MITPLDILKEFREKLYNLFLKRRDTTMNLLDAVSSHAHQCNTVVELSEAPCFERQYSSITDAIGDGLPAVNWTGIQSLVHQTISLEQKPKIYKMIVDATPQQRPFARKLNDKTIVHVPNPAPGNRPIGVGHQYSVVAVLPDKEKKDRKNWIVPLSTERVKSDQKGNEVGIKQVVDCIKSLDLHEELTMAICDSLYGSEPCRIEASNEKNLILLCRMNASRNIYFGVKDNEKNTGRPKVYGEKMKLNNEKTHKAADEESETIWVSQNGKKYRLVIKCWKNVLLRGSRKFNSSKNPFNLINITLLHDNGTHLFKRPLWLGIFGEKRQEVSLIDAWKSYNARYDIEHFFRFGKSKLLMDSYQTPETQHEELWWKLCALAYVQLYFSNKSTKAIPKHWEKHLPEFKEGRKENTLTSPSQTQRGFAQVLNEIGTPAQPCVPRGRSSGRKAGQLQDKKPDSPIIFKSERKQSKLKQETPKSEKETPEIVFSESEETENISNPQKTNDLPKCVKDYIENLGLSPPDFLKMLFKTPK
jgi:hypothetical protein